MSEAKHTPGPWAVVTDWVKSPKVVDAAGFGICHTTYAPTNAEANARLIAAAPELLEALKECQAALEWVVEQGGGPECEHDGGVICFCKEKNAINSARAAIAKATGATE